MDVTIYNDHSATELAELADDAVRGINHLTLDSGSLHYPSDVYRVLGSLTSMAFRLRQALAQIDRLLQSWLAADQIHIDGGDFEGNPVTAVQDASQQITCVATGAAAHLSRALAAAQTAIAWASYHDCDCDCDCDKAAG